MLDWLKNIDSRFLILINSHHTPFLDFIMFWASDRFIWIPFYFFIVYVLYKKSGSQTWKILLAIGVLILLSDQLSVVIKDYVMRYRPCHNLLLQSKIVLIDGNCGGKFGFVSSHAANSFALAAFLFFLIANKIKWLTVTLFLWSSLISYSRIYLGKHFPSDILGGWILGFLLAEMVFYLYKAIFLKPREESVLNFNNRS